MKAARLCLQAMLIMASTALAHAQSTVADFYRGKTVTIYVGLPPGGGFDIYARLIGKYLGAHIPGEPSVIVQNMPGAGSLLMASFIYNLGPQDGTAIGAPSTNIPFQPLVDTNGVKYDSQKLQWLPSPAESVTALIVSAASPVTKVEDMRTRETAIGSIAPGSPPTIGIGLYNEVLKTKMRPVLRLPRPAALAVARAFSSCRPA